MARLPRYERLGVQAATPQQMDFANYREGANLGRTLSQEVNKISEFLYRKEAEKAQYAGQRAVAEQGARPVLQRISEAGGPTTIPEQAAYEAANRVAVAEIQMEAGQQVEQIIRSAQQSMTPFSDVQAQLADVVDGYAATLSTIDPATAGVLRTRLQADTAQANTRYASWYQGRQRAAAQARLSASAEERANGLMEFARTEGATPETIRAGAAEIQQMLRDGGMSESQARRAYNSAYGAAVREHVVYRAATADPASLQAMRDVPTEPLPGMSFTETLTEWRAQQGVIDSRLAGYRAEATTLQGDVREAFSVLGDGGVIGPEAEASMRQRAEDLEPFSPGITSMVNDLFEVRDYTAFANQQSIPALQREIANVEAGIAGRGEAGADTPFETNRLQVLRAIETAQATAYASGDGLVYSARAGVMYGGQAVGQPIDFSGPDALQASFDRRLSEVSMLETLNGAGNQRILLPGERAALEQAITTGDLGQRMTALGMLADTVDPIVMSRVLGELDMTQPQVRQMAHVGNLVAGGNTQAASLAIRGMGAESLSVLSSPNVTGAVSSTFGAAFSGLGASGQSVTLTAITETAEAIYRGMALQEPSLAESFNEERFNQALGMALGNYTVENVLGVATLLPPNVDGVLITSAVRSPETLRALAVDPAQQFNPEVVSSGDFHPVAFPSPDGGLYYALQTGAGYGAQFLTDATDNIVLFDFSGVTEQTVTVPTPSPAMATPAPEVPSMSPTQASVMDTISRFERTGTITSAGIRDLMRAARGAGLPPREIERIRALEQRAVDAPPEG